MDIRTATLLLTFGISPAALAQQTEAPAAEPDPTIDDVVIVNGVQHPVQLRLQMLNAEREVYDLFNQLTDEPQFEIECARHNITGTRLQAQVCQPVFERQALTLEAQDHLAAYRAFLDAAASGGGFGEGASNAMENYSPMTSAAPSASIIRSQQRRLQREMKALTEEHPEFTEALVEYVNLKVRYSQSTRKVDE